MAKISTLGSGSSCESFFNLMTFDNKGEVYPLSTNLNLKMLAIVVSTKKKDISSREAMEKSTKTEFLKLGLNKLI